MTYLEKTIKSTYDFDNKDISIQEWVKNVLGEEYVNYYSDEYCRRAEKIFSLFVEKLNQEEINGLSLDLVKQIKDKKEELEKEKIKIRQEKIELNEKYRYLARSEIFEERILKAIEKLEPLNFSIANNINIPKVETTGLLCISDFHAGSEYEIKGIYDEVINKYNFKIMQDRLWYLLKQMENDDIAYDNLVIAICGDLFENILRPSSLLKLREPVLDTVINFSEFMANWIVEIQKQFLIPVNIVTVGGNHDNQRLLNSKPMFEDENLTKLFVHILQLRLKDCKDIYIDNYTDVALKTIRKTNIMFIHGEDKDLEYTMEYFEHLYNIAVDEIIAGHLHRPESKAVGMNEVGDRTVTRIGSICGIDPYAKKIRVGARPSAYFALYDENNGKTWQRNYYLG
jgi:predicted phosphodiesterase/polyhydroxyalkanoate synthesis regulator phasin